MRSDGPIQQARHDDTLHRGLRGIAVGLAMFAALGTVTAVWANPLFVRMTPVGPWEFGATFLTALLAGVTVALWVPRCRLRTSGAGGVASFLGIACPTCNKILMVIFGGPALLAWFDPFRPWLAAAGVITMGFAATGAWRAFREHRLNEGLAQAVIVEVKAAPR
jgi:peptidoglycan/LPS O-acetylase OafA/YrhL